MKFRFLREVIAHEEVEVHAYFKRAVQPPEQESTRSRLLSALLADAGRRACKRLIIDKRDAVYKNDFDAATIARSIDKGRVAEDFEHGFKWPSREPLLWVPDAVCGAIQAVLSDDDTRFHGEIAGRLVLHEF